MDIFYPSLADSDGKLTYIFILIVACECGKTIGDTNNNNAARNTKISQGGRLGPNSSPIRPMIFGGEIAGVNRDILVLRKCHIVTFLF